jgi:hypothetical protein
MRQPKADELVDRLNHFIDAPLLDELELKRIEQDASRLTDKAQSREAIASGYFVLGAVAAMRMNVAEVDRCFKAAIGWADPASAVVCRLNYVVAAQRTYQSEKSVALARELADSNPDDIEIQRQALDSAETAMDFELADHFRTRLLALGVESEGGFMNANVLLSKMAQLGVGASDLRERLDVAGSVLASHKLRYMATDMFVSDSGESLYRYATFVNADQMADLNFEIAETLAERFEDPLESVLAIGVTAYERDRG